MYLYIVNDVPLVEFTYLVVTRMPGESYRRRLGSLLLYLRYVFRALTNSLECWFCTSALGLVLVQISELFTKTKYTAGVSPCSVSPPPPVECQLKQIWFEARGNQMFSFAVQIAIIIAALQMNEACAEDSMPAMATFSLYAHLHNYVQSNQFFTT